MRLEFLLALMSTWGCDSDDPVESRELAVAEARVEVEEVEAEPGALASYRVVPVVVGLGNAQALDDLDGDGFAADVDLDDENPFLYPGADEIRCNGVDEDGDGTDLCQADIDGDGAPADIDCDDMDPWIHPQAGEDGCDGVDQNCDGIDGCDTDQDGVIDEFDPEPLDPGVTGVTEVRLEATF